MIPLNLFQLLSDLLPGFPTRSANAHPTPVKAAQATPILRSLFTNPIIDPVSAPPTKWLRGSLVLRNSVIAFTVPTYNPPAAPKKNAYPEIPRSVDEMGTTADDIVDIIVCRNMRRERENRNERTLLWRVLPGGDNRADESSQHRTGSLFLDSTYDYVQREKWCI